MPSTGLTVLNAAEVVWPPIVHYKYPLEICFAVLHGTSLRHQCGFPNQMSLPRDVWALHTSLWPRCIIPIHPLWTCN